MLRNQLPLDSVILGRHSFGVFADGGVTKRTMKQLLPTLWLALLCSVAAVSCRQSTDLPQRPAASFVVDAIALVPRPIRETLSATGTLLAREWVLLQAERAGVAREIRFEEGQPAAAGEILVVMDDSELQAQQARAAAQLELATAIEERDRELFRTGALISEADYQQTRANLVDRIPRGAAGGDRIADHRTA